MLIGIDPILSPDALALLRAMGLPEGLLNEMLRLERPTLAETAVLLGFAVLIVRTRIKEG